MKNLKTICFSVIMLFFLSCKKESSESDGVTFRANSAKPFKVDLSITNEARTEIYSIEVKDNLTSPFTYSIPKVLKGRRLMFFVFTEAETDIDAELKLKGKVLTPSSESKHASAYNGISVKSWDYIIP